MSELKELLESILSELNDLIKFKNDTLKSRITSSDLDEPDYHDGETCHLLQLAIKCLSDEWISVDDRLPDNESGYNVRVYCHDIVSGWQQDLLFNGKMWIHDGGKRFPATVTHWKPHSNNPK